jgi:flavodoxin
MNPSFLTRRQQLMQWARLIAAAGAMSLLVPSRARAQPGGVIASRRLVAYYSRTGHTRQAALVIAQTVGADLFEILPATPYPASYQETVDLNSRQRAAGEFPAVARLIPDLAQYDTVFLGYPVWAVDLPRLLYPFLRQQDFTGKTLAPFCTSAMSGLGGTEQTLRQLCPRARVLPGLALPGGGRGHNTLVNRIGADARRRSEQWGRQSLANGERR